MATSQNRLNFLSGFKNTPQGGYEDPTYLGFKIIFDFEGALPIGADDGLPPSPLFKDSAYGTSANGSMAGTNPFGLNEYNFRGNNIDFHSAQSYLVQREDGYNNGQGGKRADALNQFKNLLKQINNESPWFFQSIQGLDKLASVAKTGYNGAANAEIGFNSHRTSGKFLTFSCLESLNLRVSTLAELYRQSTFDFDYMREVVPRNLRKFKMFIYVSEIRNLNKTSRLSALSASAQALGATTNLLTNGMNPGNSLGEGSTPNAAQNSLVSGILNKSGLQSDFQALSNFGNQTEQSGVTPYIIFECGQCEFDFDSTTPIKNTMDNGSGQATPETASFIVHVGKIRTKIQAPNIRDDGNFLIVADNFELASSSVKKVNRETDALNKEGSFLDGLLIQGQNALTNFVGNSINNFVNTQVSRLSNILGGVDRFLLGNVYSFAPGAALSNPSFDNITDLAQQFNNGLDLRGLIRNESKLPNPQTSGLGGPPQRAYANPEGDSYSGVPGNDLGVPNRIYQQPKGDAYPNVPGGDLGVPQRSYPSVEADVYANVPGSDLGGPQRIYPSPLDDFYPDSPGSSLGVPDRIYPEPEGDFYPTNPGESLGVPDRVYSQPEGDVYTRVPGSDLGVPDRRYTLDNTDVYQKSPGSDLGVPDRNYDFDGGKVYPAQDQNLRSPQFGAIYEESPLQSSGIKERVYREAESNSRFDTPAGNLYGPQPPDHNSKNLGMVYSKLAEDFQPDTQSLGNLKPADGYNFSLGDINGIDED